MSGTGWATKVAIVSALIAGCTGPGRTGEFTSEAPRPRESLAVAHKLGESATIGSDSPGYKSVPIRFTVQSVMESGPGVRVGLTAESAKVGRIAYLKTKLWGGGAWQQLLAVSNKDMDNLPPVSLHLSDDFGNEYRLISIEPSAGHPLHELYPGQKLDVVIVFKGPVVPQAKAVKFEMRYYGDGEQKHEWVRVRP